VNFRNKQIPGNGDLCLSGAPMYRSAEVVCDVLRLV